MIYSNLEFLIFFSFVFALYWLAGARWRIYILLLASYLFYASWNAKFLVLILGSTLLDFVIGLQLERVAPSQRRRWLACSIAGNLFILSTFKYCDFFIESAVELLGVIGVTVQIQTLNLVLPVGISFYTFQSMSYTIDVYRGQMRACTSLARFMLYVSFFPQLVAGPIVRARDLLKQFATPPRFSCELIVSGGKLFLLGFIQKALLADQAALVVDDVFASPSRFASATIWAAVVLYALQIYWDFAGYSNMARGIARALGYELPINFNLPYLACGMREFWQRWHISLSTWLRDYLYIPLGGSRGTPRRIYINLMVTMLLGGLWHGANWTFIVWGGYHGTLLCLQRYGEYMGWLGSVQKGGWRKVAGQGITFFLVCLGWVWFRATSLGEAVLIYKAMFWPTTGEVYLIGLSSVLIGVGVIYHVVLPPLAKKLEETRFPPAVQGLAYAVIIALLVVFTPFDLQRFIYFQF